MQMHNQNSPMALERPSGSSVIRLRSWLGMPVQASATIALCLAIAAPPSWAQDGPEWGEFRPLIEINATDGDAGFHVFLDADGWVDAKLRDPDGQLIYHPKSGGSTTEQGLTENFFESAEPSCDDVPLDVVLGRFPAGTYEITGKSTDNELFDEEADLTHDLPGAPENLMPAEATKVNLDAGPVVISWTAGSTLGGCPDDMMLATILDLDSDLIAYQLVISQESPDPFLEVVVEVVPVPDANPPDPNLVTIPMEFLQAGGIYKYEVVAIEDRDGEPGNQTLSETFFCTGTTAAPFPGVCVLP